MQDKEFTMAKSLLTVLSGRSRSANDAPAKAKAVVEKAQTSSLKARRHRFDDKSGPPPPRGSLTADKLSYLDWRLRRINHVRAKSENTDHCWYDGRDTIGRNSFAIERPAPVAAAAATHREPEVHIVSAAPAPQAVQMIPSNMACIYAEEKAAGIEALKHAYAHDTVLAGMPRLSKRDSSSGSELSGSSGSSQEHSSDVSAQLRPTDKDVGAYYSKPKKSFLARAGSRLGHRKTASKAESVTTSSAESRPVSRSGPLARVWRR